MKSLKSHKKEAEKISLFDCVILGLMTMVLLLDILHSLIS